MSVEERRFSCHCCGESFRSAKPPDPQRDTGFGTCKACHERVARSWVEHGFPGDDRITYEEVIDRLNKYA
jgi:transcription elongation factor Elf1